MKRINVCYPIVLFLLLISKTGYSQFGPTPVTMNIKTPYGNVPHTYYIGSSMHNYYGQGNISSKYEFTIVLKNDSTFKVKTRINLSEKENNSVTVKNKRIKHDIFPVDTKSISRITLEGKKLTGIPADSCWLFKSYTGKINGYSFLAEAGMMFVVAIQEGEGGAIVALTKDNLLPMLIPDSKAYKLAEKNKLIKAVNLHNQSSAQSNKITSK